MGNKKRENLLRKPFKHKTHGLPFETIKKIILNEGKSVLCFELLKSKEQPFHGLPNEQFNFMHGLLFNLL